eukprot:gene8585-8767_t
MCSIFGSLEALLARQFSGSSGSGLRDDWQEVEGNWVLRPPAGVAPEAVVHFLGGAFVVTTPFGTSFDQLRIADEVQYKFDRCQKALQAELGQLPVYGVGHSMGALLHMLINARYAVKRDGNVLMSYNNRPATDSVPFLSPIIGRQEFSPTPEEMKTMIRNFYAIQRNFIIKFRDDTIDDSIDLAQLLQNSSAISQQLDLCLKTLDGDHVRPMAQAFVDLPPEVARVANNAAVAGGTLLGRLADMANQIGVVQASGPLEDLSKGVSNVANMFGSQAGGDDGAAAAADSVRQLADEVAAWMGIGDVVVKGKRAIPASVLSRSVSQ